MGLRASRYAAADRSQSASRVPLGRFYAVEFPASEKQGNKNLYIPLVRRLTYCGAVSSVHLQTLYGGDLRRMVRALADTGRLTYADTERLLRWLGEYQAENPEYDYE